MKKIGCTITEDEFEFVNKKGYKFSFILRNAIFNLMTKKTEVQNDRKLLDAGH